jgi:transporter family protein
MTWFVWAILSAFFAAATALLAKLGVAGVDSNLATAIRTSVVLVFAWLVVIVTRGGAPSTSSISGRAWLYLVLSGVATGLSWLCYFRALQLGPASKVAPIDKLSLVLVVAGAALFLKEQVSAGAVLGVFLILGGVLVLATQ